MSSSGRIVVGFNGSESSRVALTWAARTAAGRGLGVRIVYALPPVVGSFLALATVAKPASDEDLAEAGRLVLAAEHETRREVPGVEVESRVVEGPTVAALLAQLGDAELVVVGSGGESDFADLVFGATALQIVTYASCPAVVVRSTDYRDPGAEAGRVVVGVDGSQACQAAVEFAFAEADRRGAGVTAIHAWESPFLEASPLSAGADHDVRAELEAAGLRLLSESLAGWREKYPDVDVRQRLIHGEAARVLVHESPGAELVVVGTRGRGGFRALLLGSVSHAVMHHARCAVAVVRG